MLAFGPAAQRIDVCAVRRVIEQRSNLHEVLQRALQDVFRCGKTALGRCDVDRSMESRDLRRHGIDVGGSELVALEEAARQRVLRELAHLDRILERRSTTAQNWRIDAAGDSDDVKIKLRRQAPVELDLLLAVEAPGRECREVEKLEIDRLFDFVCE